MSSKGINDSALSIWGLGWAIGFIDFMGEVFELLIGDLTEDLLIDGEGISYLGIRFI